MTFKRAKDLTREQLEDIVNELQETLYLNPWENVIDPEMELGGADFIAAVTDNLQRNAPELIPGEEMVVTYDQRGDFTVDLAGVM